MSTDIKPGQVWAWQDTNLALGPHGTQFEIIAAGFDNARYRYPHEAGFDPDQTYAAARDLIAANAVLIRCSCRTGTDDTCDQHSATPAPLDPSKVKAGDTVTLTQRTATVTDEVTLVSEGPHWHFDLKVYPSTVILGVPGVDDGLWTLTDHQPAPEPEPEWLEGDVADISVRGCWAADLTTLRAIRTDAGWRTKNGDWSDVNVESVRPLVVIDPAAVDVVAIAKAMHQVDYPGLDFALNLDQSVHVAKARAALAHLGIEATS